MTTVHGHFNGKVIVPNDPSKLRANQTVTITGEPAEADFGTVGYVLRRMTSKLSDEDAQQMIRAIEEECERVDPEPDVRF